MYPIMKMELVNGNYFCLNSSFSVKYYLLVSPQILLNRTKPHPFPENPLSLFPGFHLCCGVYTHLFVYIWVKSRTNFDRLLCWVDCVHMVHASLQNQTGWGNLTFKSAFYLCSEGFLWSLEQFFLKVWLEFCQENPAVL